MFTRKRLLILIPLLLIGACTAELVREMQGPSDSAAYRWVYGESAPEYVTSLKSEYYSHLKGYGIYIAFKVPPSRLDEIIDTESSTPLYRADLDYFERWDHEHTFREMLPDEPPDVKICRKVSRTIDGQSWSTVYDPSAGFVYCFYLSDSDISP